MKKLIIALILAAILGTTFIIATETPKPATTALTAEASIESHLAASRQFVEQLTKNHSKVLHQFDAFAQTLGQSYASGEGMTRKDIHLIIIAMTFAADKHALQKRKDPESTPYIIHPIGVAHTLMVIGNVRDRDILIGALLHDTVEDTQTTFEEIEQKFGARVAGFVREVTDDKSLPKDVRKQLQIEHAPKKSAGAAQIKLADKLYNLRDLLKNPPLDWDQKRLDNYFTWAQAVVDSLPKVNTRLKSAVDQTIAEHSALTTQ